MAEGKPRQWFILTSSGQRGPFPEEKLLDALGIGILLETTKVWSPGLQGWVPAMDCAELKDRFVAHQPPPPDARVPSPSPEVLQHHNEVWPATEPVRHQETAIDTKPEAAEKWIVLYDGGPGDPVSKDALKAALEKGEIPADVRVRKEEWDSWIEPEAFLTMPDRTQTKSSTPASQDKQAASGAYVFSVIIFSFFTLLHFYNLFQFNEAAKEFPDNPFLQTMVLITVIMALGSAVILVFYFLKNNWARYFAMFLAGLKIMMDLSSVGRLTREDVGPAEFATAMLIISIGLNLLFIIAAAGSKKDFVQ